MEVINPNWPVIDEAVSFPSQLGVAPPFPYWVSMVKRSFLQASSKRGRQYELDTVQPGEYQATYDNRDGALLPGNTNSPFYPAVTPFRALRKRAQWPPTANVLTGDQAAAVPGTTTTTALSSLSSSLLVTAPGGTGGQVLVDATAWQGNTVFDCAVASGVAASTVIWQVQGFSVRPGTPHTFSVYVRTTVAQQCTVKLQWVDVTGTPISGVQGAWISVAANTWTRLSVTATPPVNAAGAQAQALVTAATTAAMRYQLDGLQLEYGGTAPSSWVQPGTWYPLFTGWVERWPQDWTDSGTFGRANLTAVDTFAALSQQLLKPPIYSDILSLSPDWFYPMDEGAGALTIADRTGNLNPSEVTQSQYGPGKLTFGNGLQSNVPLDLAHGKGVPQGAAPAVATFGNTDPNGGSSVDQPATYIDMATGGVQPPLSSVAGWTRIICFRTADTRTATSQIIWFTGAPTYIPNASGNATACALGVQGGAVAGPPAVAAGGLVLDVTGNAVAASFPPVNDGDWHFAAVLANQGATQFTLWVDGYTASATFPAGALPTGVPYSEIVGCYSFFGAQQVLAGFDGDAALYAQWSRQLTVNELSFLYHSWRNGWSPDDSSSGRYARILGWAGYKGATKYIGTSATAQMGPASDVAQGYGARGSGQNGLDVLTALQNTVITENGNHYVAADGTLTFESRANRYGIPHPTIVFGERTDLGEIPYTDVAFDFDLTRSTNDAQITQYVTNSIHESTDSASQTQYGARTLSRTVNTYDPYEANDAATFFVLRYKQPELRVQKIAFNVAGNPSSWPTMLSLELGTRCRVQRRPPVSGAAIQWDGFVESISWSMSNDGSARVELELSPSAALAFWLLSALHTTVQTAAAAGVTSVVLAPLSTSASIPFTAYVPDGLKLTLEPGTSNAETLTVASVTGGAVGYTSVTVTFTAATAYAHAAGAVVCEQLPASMTDPTSHDADDVLGTSTTLGY